MDIHGYMDVMWHIVTLLSRRQMLPPSESLVGKFLCLLLLLLCTEYTLVYEPNNDKCNDPPLNKHSGAYNEQTGQIQTGVRDRQHLSKRGLK